MALTSIRGILLLALLAVPLAASSVLPVDFDELCETAHHVVAGTIVEITPSRNEQTGHIYSDLAIVVTHSSPGSLAGRRYTFRMIGGEMDGKVLSIADFPQFKLNDKVVLFLHGETSTVLGPTIGLWQGVFFVEEDGNGVSDHLHRPVVGVKNDQVLRGAKSAGSAAGMSLDDFFAEVEAHRPASQ